MSQVKTLPIIAAVVIVASAVVLLFFSRSLQSDRSETNAPEQTVAEVDEAAPTELTTPDAIEEAELQDAAPEQEASREVVESAHDHEAKREWIDDALWIEGRVAASSKTPADERLIVFAVDKERRAGQLYEKGDPGAYALEDEPKYRAGLISVSPVDPNGAFRLPVPKEAETVHLAIAGRYHFSRSTSPVAVPSSGDLVLSGELGAWITGKLKRPVGSDASLEGIELELGMDISGGFDALNVQNQAWEIGGEADGGGRFQFRGVNPATDRGVVVQADEFAGMVQLGIQVEPGQHLNLDLQLFEGATVRGRVVGEDGEPLADVEVSAAMPGLIGRAIGEVRDAETDEAGLFELPHVATGRIAIIAEREGFLTEELKLDRELADRDLYEGIELVLSTGRTVTGRVLFADKTPVANVNVNAAPDLASAGQMDGMSLGTSARPTTTTDEDGRFTVSGLSGLAYQVVARIDVEEGEREGSWKASQGAIRDSGPIELILEGLTSAHGRVTDQNGAPMTEFEISAKKQAAGQAGLFAGLERQKRDFEDEEGRFEFKELEADMWELTAKSEGFGALTIADVELPQAEDGAELLFALEPVGRVEGLVLDTGGNPASGAEITLQVDLATRMNAMGGSSLPSITADHEGRFVFELDPGMHSLIAKLEGFAESEEVACDVKSGELLEGIVLTLRLGGTLTGVVLDAKGEPASGRMVIVQKTPNFSSQKMMTTKADGTFRQEHLEPGNWQVVATANFMEGEVEGDGEEAMSNFLNDMKIEFVEIVDGEETHLVLGALPKDPVKVTGRVLHAGSPVDGGLLMAVSENSEGLGGMKMQSLKDGGHFEIDLPGPGNYLITYQNNNGMGQQNNTEVLRNIPEGVKEYEMDIELPGGRISGLVTNSKGDPIEGCRVTLNVERASYGSMMGGHYVEAATDTGGKYNIPYLSADTYSVGAGGLALGGMLGGAAQNGRVVKSGLSLGDGQWLERVDFRLEAPGKVTGIVTDLGGKPVNQAMVFIRNEAGVLVESFSLVATDASGRFSYDGLSPGSYTVSARSGQQVTADSDLVRVTSGETAEASLILSEGTTLLVTVIDKEGEELGTKLSVVDGNGREYGSMLSFTEIMERMGSGFSSKEHRIGPVPPGTYRLVATTDSGLKAKKSVTVSTGKPERKVKLRLK